MNTEALLVLALMIFMIGIVLKRGSDIDITVKRSKTLESRLKEELGAKGEGLGQLANSVRGRVAPQMSADLDRIVGMRNPVVHQKDRDHLPDRQEYEQLCDRVEDQLNHLKPANQGLIRLLGCLVYLIMAVMAYAGLANMY